MFITVNKKDIKVTNSIAFNVPLAKGGTHAYRMRKDEELEHFEQYVLAAAGWLPDTPRVSILYYTHAAVARRARAARTAAAAALGIAHSCIRASLSRVWRRRRATTCLCPLTDRIAAAASGAARLRLVA